MQPSTTFSHWFSRRAVPTIVSIIALTFLMMALFLVQIGASLDRQSKERTAHYVATAAALRQEEMRRTLLDYAAWGDAYRNLHPRVDVGWAYESSNMGSTLFEDLGLNYVIVIGPTGATQYAVVNGEMTNAPAEELLAGGIDKLAELARRSGYDTEPVEGRLIAGSEPVFAVAAVISPGADVNVSLEPGPRSVLVLGYTLTPERLKAAAQRFLVPDLRLGRLDGSDAIASKPFVTVDGRHAATIAWTPDRPGLRLLRGILPWLCAAALLLAALTYLALRHAYQSARLLDRSARRLAAAKARAEHLAMHDVVTGLPNRAMLTSRLDALLAAHPSECTAVLYIDLDRFKPVNDLFGHHAGDQVLAEIALRLKSCVRDTDIVARVGGDEFVVATTTGTPGNSEALCRRLCELVGRPVYVENAQVQVGLSIGAALAPQDATSSADLIRCADIAMYQAKNDGRGSYRFYSAEMDAYATRRRELEIELRRAIENREFVLHFQPRFDTGSLNVTSVEALIRWQHPERGLIQPSEFISVAEETGLIVDLDLWTLREACRLIAPFGNIGVSINLSPLQFRKGAIVESVARALADSGLNPARLELEVTEGVLLEDTHRARALIDQLKELGVTLAMDDFGTGYSSLSYLQSFPFDRVKIDRSFVSRLLAAESSRVIVQAILGLGRSLGIQVTAEGVETPEQFLLLRADGCHEVQGYLLARPMPAPDLKRFIETPPDEIRRSIAA